MRRSLARWLIVLAVPILGYSLLASYFFEYIKQHSPSESQTPQFTANLLQQFQVRPTPVLYQNQPIIEEVIEATHQNQPRLLVAEPDTVMPSSTASFEPAISLASSTSSSSPQVAYIPPQSGGTHTIVVVESQTGGGGLQNITPSPSSQLPVVLFSATSTLHPVISELFIDMAGADTEEFIKLFNPTTSTVDLSGWSIQYLSGSTTSTERIVKKNFTATSSISGESYFIIGMGDFSSTSTVSDMTWSQSLSNSGATVFLAASQSVITDITDAFLIDRVAYGSGTLLLAEGSPALLPLEGEKLTRQNNVDTNDNAADFSALVNTSSTLATSTESSSTLEIFTDASSTIATSTLETPTSTDELDLSQDDTVDGPATDPEPVVEPESDLPSEDTTEASSTDQLVPDETSTSTVSEPEEVEPEETTVELPDHLIIAALFIDMAGSDNSEFIKLYNPTQTDIDISGWSIQYLSGSATSTERVVKKNFPQAAVVLTQGFYTIGTGAFAGSSDMTWSQSLNNTGASVILVSNQELILDAGDSDIIDRVAYGSGSLLLAETSPAELPPVGSVIARSGFLDSGDNSIDFAVSNP